MENICMLDIKEIEFYNKKGYLLIKQALNKDLLTSLIEESEYLTNSIYSEGLDLTLNFGGIIEPLNPYFKTFLKENVEYDDLTEKEFQEKRNSWKIWSIFESIGKSLLKNEKIFMFNQQHIVKSPYDKENPGLTRFRRHKDGQYLPQHLRHLPNLAIYLPLQNMDQHNGSLVLYPKDSYPSSKGIQLNLAFGDILILNSNLEHESGENKSYQFRRSYMVQYSIIDIKNHLN